MRDLDAAEIAALASDFVVARDLLWVTAKNRSTGEDESLGFWSDVRTVTMAVRDGRSGEIVSRDFTGVGLAMNIGEVPLTTDLTVRTVEIGLPQTDDLVNQLVRGYDVRNAPMQLYRAFFDPDTRVLLAPAKPRFVGYVDGAPIVTPAEGEEGSVTLNCVSTTQELTRTSAETRSHESQILRNPADTFYKDAATVGTWPIFWGLKKDPITGGTTSPSVLSSGGGA